MEQANSKPKLSVVVAGRRHPQACGIHDLAEIRSSSVGSCRAHKASCVPHRLLPLWLDVAVDAQAHRHDSEKKVEARARRVFGAGFRTSVSQAVLANSTAGHAFESDDMHKPSLFHPGSICLPVALACAEAEGSRTGRDVITGMVAGYEVGTRVGTAGTMGLFFRGWASARHLRHLCFGGDRRSDA